MLVFHWPQITNLRKHLTKGYWGESMLDNSYPPLTRCCVYSNILKTISATVCIQAVDRGHQDGFCLSRTGKPVSFLPLLMLTWIVTSVLNSFLPSDCCLRFSTSDRAIVTLSVRFPSSINKETTHMQSILFSWFTDSRLNGCSYFGVRK